MSSSLKLLCRFNKLTCWCHFCNTFNGPHANSPSSFLTTLGLTSQRPAPACCNFLIHSHLVRPSFTAASPSSMVTFLIHASLALFAALFTALCHRLKSFLATLEFVLSILVTATFLYSMNGVRTSVLSSNHSDCFLFLRPTVSSAVDTIHDLNTFQFSSVDRLGLCGRSCNTCSR